MRLLENWLESYAAFVSDSEGDDEYKKWMAVAVIAGALERKVFVEWDHLRTLYPNFFIALVGSSAVRKSTVMNPGENLLRDLDIHLTPKDVTGPWLINRMSNIGQIIPGKEVETHASITACCSELGIFIGNDRRDVKWYQTLCELYDCKDIFDKGTISRDLDIINNVWFNLIGCITPMSLKEVMPETNLVGGGLAARFIFVWAKGITRRITMGRQTSETLQLRKALVDDLKVINSLQGGFIISPEFLSLYHTFYQSGDFAPDLAIHADRFAAYTERKPTHLIKLAMVSSVARDSLLTLTKEDFGIAMMYLETTEVNMPKVFANFNEKPIGEAHYIRVATLIKIQGPMTFRQLYGNFYLELEQRELYAVAQTLATIQPPHLRIDKSQSGRSFRDDVITYIGNEKEREKTDGNEEPKEDSS